MFQHKVSSYVWPGETHIGPGAAQMTGQEAKKFQAKHAFVITDPGIVAAGLLDPVLSALEVAEVAHTVFDQAVPNPLVSSVDAAAQAFHESEADIIVGLGGGSSLDTAKAVRIQAGGPPEASIGEYFGYLGDKARPAPHPFAMPAMIAIPTTAGTGSEVTPWAVVTEDETHRKSGVGGVYALPSVAIVDPELMLTLPPHLTAATGVDALSHCIEAYVSTNNNPLLDPIILHGIELIGRSLRVAVAQGSNLAARQDLAEGSMIGGLAISSNWLGVCHSLAHPLSSFANTHHGVAIALMLPHQMQYSLIGAMDRYAKVGQALGMPPIPNVSLRQQAEQAIEAVRELINDVGLPTHLRDIEMPEDLIPGLAQKAYTDLNWMTNPRTVNESTLEQLYRQAL